MADVGTTPSQNERLGALVAAYRGILRRYEEIVILSREERRILGEGAPIAEVNAILREKKQLLSEIRGEEERVTGAREWWKKVRRSLPPRDGQDLLSLLDAISRSVERSLALEAECRALLSQATAWGTPAFAPPAGSNGPSRPSAVAAYARTTESGDPR